VCAPATSDRSILIHDVRASSPFTSRLDGHKQEVCGLKWSPDSSMLASGGNDNKVRLHELDHVLGGLFIA
jgi:cell division cycle 20-like protein 1, cofactor of APC complex